MAHAVRENRRPVAADNPFVTTEQAVSQQIEKSLDLYRDMRDRTQELLFKAIYNSPLIEALAGLRAPYADASKPRARDEHAEQLLAAKIEAIRTREEQGGFAEAVLRIMLARRPGRAYVRCARLPPRPTDQAGAPGAARAVARMGEGRRQGASVHAALRPGARARRPAAAAADREGAA